MYVKHNVKQMQRENPTPHLKRDITGNNMNKTQFLRSQYKQ